MEYLTLARQLLSLSSRNRKAQIGGGMLQPLKPGCLKAVLHNKTNPCIEKPAVHKEEWGLLAETRQSPCPATETQCNKN